MATIPNSEFKARTSAIVRNLADGGSVIITRHGKPCAKITGIPQLSANRQSLRGIKGTWSDLPDASYDEFQALKGIWRPKAEEPDAKPEDLLAR